MTDLDLNDFRSCLQLWQSIKWIKSIFLRTSPTTSRRSIQSIQSIKLMQLLKSSAFWKAYINCKKGENRGISGHRIQNWRWGVISENHPPTSTFQEGLNKKMCVLFFFSVWEFLGVKFMLVEDSFQGGTPGHAGAGLGSWDWNADLCRSGSGAGSKNHGSTFSTRKMPFSFISWFHVPFARWVYGILMQDLMGLLNFFFHVIYVNGDAKMLVFLNLNILTWSRCLVLKV